ncbi:MAG: hypothetical protein ACXVJL_17115, partial [Candidatus Angelobacter sp.]
GQKSNMGQLMKDAMAQLGGRGGGSVDMAQGGLPFGAGNRADVERALHLIAATLKTSQPHS